MLVLLSCLFTFGLESFILSNGLSGASNSPVGQTQKQGEDENVQAAMGKAKGVTASTSLGHYNLWWHFMQCDKSRRTWSCTSSVLQSFLRRSDFP